MQINLKIQNLIIIVGFSVTVILCLLYDLYAAATTPPGVIGSFVRLISFDVWHIVFLPTTSITAALLFGVAFRYNKIRQHKSNAYLSSLIYFSAIYQGIGYVIYALQYMFSNDKDMDAIVEVGLRFNIPLGILALLFFAFMAMEVFLKPSITHGKENRLEIVILVMQVFGIVFGIIYTLFVYTPNLGTFEIIMGGTGFIVFGIIFILVVIIIVKIFKILRSNTDPLQIRALRAIAIQLLLLLPVTLLMVLVALASVTGLSYELEFVLLFVQCGLSIFIALLYFPAFITPSDRQHKSQDNTLDMR